MLEVWDWGLSTAGVLWCVATGGRRCFHSTLGAPSRRSLLQMLLSLVSRFVWCAACLAAALASTQASELGTLAVPPALWDVCMESELPQGLVNQDSELPANPIVPGAGHTHLGVGWGNRCLVRGEGSWPKPFCSPLAA